VGGYLIIDDYGLIEECRAAVEDYRRKHGITAPIEKIDWIGVRWRREDEPDPGAASIDAGAPQASIPGSARAGSPGRPHIPTERELQLERELGHLRERLRAADERSSEEQG
jgi:hypothetical protein